MVTGIAGGVVAVWYPAVSLPHVWAHCGQSGSCLKHCAISLILRADREGTLPPAVVSDAEGRPLHSWRSAILPYLDRDDLYAQLRFDEPWDSPANLPVTSTPVDVFACPGSGAWGAGGVCYFAVTGPATVWQEGVPLRLSEVSDRLDSTLLLIEGPARQPWGKPGDLSFEEALDLLTSPVQPAVNGGHVLDRGRFSKPTMARHVAMANGKTYRLQMPLPEPLARALLTAGGGEPIGLKEALAWEAPQTDWARVACLALFLATAAAPFVRHRLGSRAPQGDAA
ncbi:MAG: DUF1559 domain-containing protein [Planctomycetota bacterium]